MLRRPLTVLSLSPEDIADFEDRAADRASAAELKIRKQTSEVRARARYEPSPAGAALGRPAHTTPAVGPAAVRYNRVTGAVEHQALRPLVSPPHHQFTDDEEESEDSEVDTSYYARAQAQAARVPSFGRGQISPAPPPAPRPRRQSDDEYDSGVDNDAPDFTRTPTPPRREPRLRAQAAVTFDREGDAPAAPARESRPRGARGHSAAASSPPPRETRLRGLQHQQQQDQAATATPHLTTTAEPRHHSCSTTTTATGPGARNALPQPRAATTSHHNNSNRFTGSLWRTGICICTNINISISSTTTTINSTTISSSRSTPHRSSRHARAKALAPEQGRAHGACCAAEGEGSDASLSVNNVRA
ncbi:hypothetical protein N658DRAFT_503585 [Parathielavia hyrcaniae]|uniref:Uncharacterized protein n=1 Tax=Parathielavia hyrcaniae TaxID=113614 RepID=A0AAN6QDZ8_9PEZI|nr:hypothetical protein N658DRAFT_503585 [Parathielavia hyrcaniae]